MLLNFQHEWLDSFKVFLNSTDTWGSCNGGIVGEIVYKATFVDPTISVGITAIPGTVRVTSASSNWSDLCSGRYNLDVFSDNFSQLLVVGVTVLPLNSNDQNCDGASWANVVGGNSPFSYSYDYAAYDVDPSKTELCPGIHTIHVIDDSQDTLGVNFGIADASNYYQDPTINGTIDSVYFNTQNCQFDYNTPVDSIFVTSFLEINQTSSLVTFEIWQSGVSTEYTDTIFATYSLTGPNLISVTFFCGALKATNLVYQMVTQASINGVAGINPFSSDKNGIEIFPNPISEKLSVKSSKNESLSFEIVSITGKPIESGMVTYGITEINTSKLTDGVYFIRFDNNDTRKVIIKK